ncbi:MAG: ABC transporter ATP-binding protein [Defluviitaleaceae bacterium]|nr:ABC transporter ATP-binding protein [Defluviitaleaceae bacterium]
MEINELSKNYDSFHLDSISFNVPMGKIVGLIGANGAGKTTTLNLIQNNIRKDSGQVLFFGNPSEDRLPQSVAVVADTILYDETWSISQLSKIVQKFHKNWDNMEFERLLGKFRLAAGKKISQLSKGMGIKLMIAVAIAQNARLLILDEPTSGLDPMARDDICQILLDFVAEGDKSVLLSTHITHDLEKAADEVVFLVNGQVRLNDRKHSILEKHSNDRLKTLDDIILHLHEGKWAADGQGA